MKIYSLVILLSQFEPVSCSMSCSNCCFLTCLQVFQETEGDLLLPSLIIFHHLLWSTQSKALTQSINQMFFWNSFAFYMIQQMLKFDHTTSGVYVLSRFSHVQLFMTLWTVTHQAPLSMGFSRQEYWSGLPCPPPGDLPNPGIEPGPPALQVNSLPTESPGKPSQLIHPSKSFDLYTKKGKFYSM